MLVPMLSHALALAAEILSPTSCAACEGDAPRGALFCAACGSSVRSPLVARPREVSVARYEGAAAAAVVKMKYAGRPDIAGRLGHEMGRAVERAAGPIDVVVPVPLHPNRLASRGFDQASLLAAPIAARLRVPRETRAIARILDTPRQASLDRGARAANVGRAFACRRRDRVAGKRVLLVDDVRTTGATLAACAAVLEQAGAATVVSAVFASRDRED
jgi:ComF family protein